MTGCREISTVSPFYAVLRGDLFFASLTLPLRDQVRMNLVPGRRLRQRRFAGQGLEKLYSLASQAFASKAAEGSWRFAVS